MWSATDRCKALALSATIPNVPVVEGRVGGRLADQLGHEGCPARLVAGAQPGAVVAVEVLEEGHPVLPVRVGLEEADVAQDGAAALGVSEEDPDEAASDLVGGPVERHSALAAAWELHRQARSIIAVILAKRLDHQVIDGEPDRAPPVGVAA